MTDTTYDEARRCYRCGELGEVVADEPYRPYNDGVQRIVTRGARLHHVMCRNERCRNYGDIVRMIQVNPDGTIPPPVTKRTKAFPEIPDLTEAVNKRLEEQVRLEKQGGAEVSRN